MWAEPRPECWGRLEFGLRGLGESTCVSEDILRSPGGGIAPFSRPDGGGAAAAEDASSIQARTQQASQANAGPQSLVLGQDQAARSPREPQGRGGVGSRALGLDRTREPGISSSSPSTLRQAGRGEEGARPEAPRARRHHRRVPLFLGASSRAVASRGRFRLRGGGGERRARGGVNAPPLLSPRLQGMGKGAQADPPRPGQGAPPCQSSGPRGDLERARRPARRRPSPSAGAFSSRRAGQLPSAQPRPATPFLTTPLPRPSRPRPRGPRGPASPEPSDFHSTRQPGRIPGAGLANFSPTPAPPPPPPRDSAPRAAERPLSGPSARASFFRSFCLSGLCVCVSVPCISFRTSFSSSSEHNG